MPSEERKPVAFGRFGGLRLDQAIDEVGPEGAIFLRDVDWDGSTGKLRPRDGFQKLKTADASGPYKGLFAHSNSRLLATKRVTAESLKLVALDAAGAEKVETSLNATAAKSTFARFGTPSAAYTYMRTNTPEQKVVRFNGSAFSEPTATVDKNPDGTGGESGKAMPKGALMVAWPAGDNRFVVANTGSTGGPNGAASSSSHVWFSDPGDAESWHVDLESQAGEANYVQLSPGDGEEITALAVFGSQLFVFKETKFFVFYGIGEDGEGRPDFLFREQSLGEGSRMKRASSEVLAETSDVLAAASPSGVYFATTDGLYATTGGEPAKLSQALKPLEENVSFEGPMADFLAGSSETFRWPASGVAAVGTDVFVKRYEFIFRLDTVIGEWVCWRMPSTSMAIWAGLAGGSPVGVEATPGTAANESGIGTIAWSNPSNGKVVDGSFATAALKLVSGKPGVSNYLPLTNPAPSIPEGATIVGVKVLVSCRATPQIPGLAQVADEVLQLKVGGVLVGENKASATWWPTATGVRVYGGSDDLWGLSSISRAAAIASNFGVVIAARQVGSGNITAEVDGVAMVFYYVVGESNVGMRPRLLIASGKSVYFTSPSAAEQAGTRDAQWQSGFYDLGSQDEKTLVESKVWGQGEIQLEGYKDLEPTADFSDDLDLGESPSRGRGESTQTAVLFSHRLKLQPGSSVQRLVRYMRETRTATTETD